MFQMKLEWSGCSSAKTWGFRLFVFFFLEEKKHKNEMEKRKRKICSIGFNLGLVFI